ncbi:MAG TPA: cyclic peptide export ABC transporter [Pyrinomonadaceae bacterium]|jgi:putative ATP-binding cassette transporter
MKLLSFLLRYSKTLLVTAIVAGIVAGGSSMGLLALTGARINQQAPNTRLIWAFVACCLLYSAARAASELTLATLSQRAIFDLRLRLSRQIMAAPLRLLEDVGAARLLATLTEDVTGIVNGVLVMPTICINVVVVLGCLAYLGWLSVWVLLTVVVFFTLGTLIYQLPMKFANSYLRSARQQADLLYGHFRALTQGNKELKIHAPRRSDFFKEQLQPTAATLRRENLVAQRIFTFAGIWGQLLFYVMLGLLLFAVPAVLPVSTPVLTAYALTILFMMGPLTNTVTLMPILSRSGISLKKIEDLGLSLAGQSTEEAAFTTKPVEPTWQSLQLIEVTHSYHREKENSNFTLGPINLTFQPGELVFLIGGNGSGKTTLAKLLTGLYTPERGHIRFNGEPITQRNREQFRQLFSVVFYDFFLFENFLGLKTEKLDEQARAYIEQLQLSHKVKVEDGKLSTLDLSAGQRKRLALLTAYLEDRPFYLFDEWAADQDPLFKEIFYLQILPDLKARGKTVLVISHDDRYYNLGDRVIKLENGQLEQDSRVAQARPIPPPARAASTNVTGA